MQNFISGLLVLTAFLGNFNAQTLSRETVLIKTDFGTIKVKLYEETPLHKANFLRLVQQGFYDSLLFHRVIHNFMIQGGDPLSKTAKSGDSLGHGDLGYTVPAEFNEQLIHKKGTLCAARESDLVNPAQASSASQFYLVQGKVRTPEDLKKYESRINKNYYNACSREFEQSDEGIRLHQKYKQFKSEAFEDSAAFVLNQIETKVQSLYQRKPEYTFNTYQTTMYATVGGTPHLDGTYTVFGEIIEGMEVVETIAKVKTDARDRPVTDIRMRMKLVVD